MQCFEANGLLRISPIGSSSVNGLVAKPIIDILLELVEGYDVEATLDLLDGHNWLVMAHDRNNHTIDLNKGYTLQGYDERVFHLHIKPIGDWDELYFTDYLKSHPRVAQEYGSLKRSLKELFEYDRDAYTAAKTHFIQKYTTIARKDFGGRYDPEKVIGYSGSLGF